MSNEGQLRSVAARFGTAAGSYDEQSVVQRAVAERLVAMAEGRAAVERILDVGCGTGVLTGLLARRFPTAEIHAVDVAEAMIDRAREQFRGNVRIHWHVADAREIETDLKFPLIFSSSALHWMAPLADTFSRLAALLEPDGHVMAALMLDRTLRELHATRGRVAPHKPRQVSLPDADSVLQAARAASLVVVQSEEEELRVRYESAADFLRSLHALGVTAQAGPGRALLNRAELDQLIANYDRDHAGPSGGVSATYQVLYLEARKDD